MRGVEGNPKPKPINGALLSVHLSELLLGLGRWLKRLLACFPRLEPLALSGSRVLGNLQAASPWQSSFSNEGEKKDDEINFNSCLNPHCYSYSVQMTEKKKSVSFRREKNLQEKS